MANQEKLQEAFDKYLSTLTKTSERRKLWTSETKNIIIETLTAIQKTFKMGWRIQKLEQTENYQTINIHIDNHSSGIIQTNNNGTSIKSFTKYGGYLAYCQSYNGKINVIIGFPYIEEWVSQMDIKVIATIEPNEVTEELITNNIIHFLKTMEEWEGKDREPREPVGYKLQEEKTI